MVNYCAEQHTTLNVYNINIYDPLKFSASLVLPKVYQIPRNLMSGNHIDSPVLLQDSLNSSDHPLGEMEKYTGNRRFQFSDTGNENPRMLQKCSTVFIWMSQIS